MCDEVERFVFGPIDSGDGTAGSGSEDNHEGEGEGEGERRKCEAVMNGKAVEPSFAKGSWSIRWRE